MEKLNREQLNKLDKDILISLILSLQEQLEAQTESIKMLTLQVEKLTEQIAIQNAHRFGKSTEKNLTGNDQLSIYDFDFNDPEATLGNITLAEPEMDTVVIKEHLRKKRKGKREEDLSGFPVIVVDHEMTETELYEIFPEGYTNLPDEIYKKLEIIPTTFEVHEHHVHVYKGKNGQIVKADRPKEMLNNSIATPSLVAAIINAKYVNALPLYRQEQEYARNNVNISRQVMANWMVTVSERYISLIYDRLKEEITKSSLIHADETPVTVIKDGREGTHKNYMWVYRTGDRGKAKPAILYDYQRTRNADSPKDFLKGFSGKLVCDGYQVYHTLENSSETALTVCGCWTHARRPFANVVKSLGKEKAAGTAANEALIQIGNIYHTDNSLSKLPPSKRRDGRKKLVKPLVNDFFKWCRETLYEVPPGSQTAKGINYCLNQEKYLRQFLTDPEIPLDNNLAEQAIRPFCVGKKNWMFIDTMHGANASAMLYSIVETAKANDLHIHSYLQHLLTEIPKHMDDTNLDFIDDLLPWSDALPEKCHKHK